MECVLGFFSVACTCFPLRSTSSEIMLSLNHPRCYTYRSRNLIQLPPSVGGDDDAINPKGCGFSGGLRCMNETKIEYVQVILHPHHICISPAIPTTFLKKIEVHCLILTSN